MAGNSQDYEAPPGYVIGNQYNFGAQSRRSHVICDLWWHILTLLLKPALDVTLIFMWQFLAALSSSIGLTKNFYLLLTSDSSDCSDSSDGSDSNGISDSFVTTIFLCWKFYVMKKINCKEKNMSWNFFVMTNWLWWKFCVMTFCDENFSVILTYMNVYLPRIIFFFKDIFTYTYIGLFWFFSSIFSFFLSRKGMYPIYHWKIYKNTKPPVISYAYNIILKSYL